MTEANKTWQLHGSYFETCNCVTACPCVWLEPPTEGECKLLVAWHIEKGYLNHINLDGLNLALACYAQDNMKNGGWQAALYVDERSNEQQFNALTQIFSGQAGGHPEILMSFVGRVLGIQKVKIEFQAENNQRKLIIPNIAQAEISGIQGISGGNATINNPPLCVVPSHAANVARSKHYQYRDYGHDWTFSERNGYYSEFDYHP
jgi:hypothetical protein